MQDYFMTTARDLGRLACCDIMLGNDLKRTTLAKWEMLYDFHQAIMQSEYPFELDWETINEEFTNAYNAAVNRYKEVSTIEY